MNVSFAQQQFYQALQSSQVNLGEAALYIALEEYPDLEVEAYLNALDTMADQVRQRLPLERYPLRVLQTINRYLYEDLGFRGNTDDYYDPRNSFLNQVLDRRLGIPITLSLVYLEIAKRLDFPMVGVGFPGHFLIRPDLPDMSIHVDAFHQGEILFEQDCQNRLQQIYGQPVQLEDRFLQAVTPQQFLVRMLTNLKQIYLQRGDFSRSLAVIEKILLVTPEAVMERRDRGILCYQLGRWAEARRELQAYLESYPQGEDLTLIYDLLQRIRED